MIASYSSQMSLCKFSSEVNVDWCNMNTLDTPNFGVQVAGGDNTFGFILELVYGKSSLMFTVLAEDFTLSFSFIL